MEIDALVSSYPQECMEAAVEMGKSELMKIDNDVVTAALSGVSKFLSLSYISKNYLHRSTSWISQRMSGAKVDGRQARFTGLQVLIISYALKEMAKELDSVRLF